MRKRLDNLQSVLAGLDMARQHQAEAGKPMSIEAIAWALEVDRHDVRSYADGKYIPCLDGDGRNAEDVAEGEQIAAAIARAVAECRMDLTNFATDRGNMMGPVFLLKNNYGYTDRTEQDIKVQLPTFAGEDDLQ